MSILIKGGRIVNEGRVFKSDIVIEGERIKGFTENKGEGAKSKSVSGALPNEDGTLTLEIYIDRSLVEGFFNDYKAISIRAYPEEKDSKGLELYADGTVSVKELYVASMSSIFD